MPLDFVIIGVIFMTLFLMLSLLKPQNIIMLLGLFCVLLSYFIGINTFAKFSLNWLFLIGLILVILSLSLNSKSLFQVFVVSASLAIVYVSLNIFNLEFNMFFTILPMCIIGVSAGMVCVKNIYKCILQVVLTLVFCEIVNAFVMIEHLDFWALFGYNFIICIVLCVLPYLVGFCAYKLVGKIKSLRKRENALQ